MKIDPEPMGPEPVRTGAAPESFSNAGEDAEIRILSVDLEDGEEVDWIWIFGVDGQKRVSGYRLISKEDDA